MGRLGTNKTALETNGWMDGGNEGQGSQVLVTFGSVGVRRSHESLRALNLRLRVQQFSVQLYMSDLDKTREKVFTHISKRFELWHSFLGTAIDCIMLTVCLDVRIFGNAITRGLFRWPGCHGMQY